MGFSLYSTLSSLDLGETFDEPVTLTSTPIKAGLFSPFIFQSKYRDQSFLWPESKNSSIDHMINTLAKKLEYASDKLKTIRYINIQ